MAGGRVLFRTQKTGTLFPDFGEYSPKPSGKILLVAYEIVCHQPISFLTAVQAFTKTSQQGAEVYVVNVC